MDIVAKAWCRGDDSSSGDANPATHRTMKGVRPTILLGEAAQYLWPLADPLTEDIRRHSDVLSRTARSVVALGWGLDMVVGHGAILADVEVSTLIGERWLPFADSRGGGLRVPLDGTLDDLVYRYRRFVERLGPDGFVPPPSLSVFRKVQYRRASDPPRHPVAVFSLLKLDASGRRAFDTAHQALRVAGMVRCAAKLAAQHSGGTWTEEKINAFILGHGDSNGAAPHIAVGPHRFAYLPLPTIESRGEGKARVVGSVRRVMLYCFAEGCENEITWAQRMLSARNSSRRTTNNPSLLSWSFLQTRTWLDVTRKPPPRGPPSLLWCFPATTIPTITGDA